MSHCNANHIYSRTGGGINIPGNFYLFSRKTTGFSKQTTKFNYLNFRPKSKLWIPDHHYCWPVTDLVQQYTVFLIFPSETSKGFSSGTFLTDRGPCPSPPSKLAALQSFVSHKLFNSAAVYVHSLLASATITARTAVPKHHSRCDLLPLPGVCVCASVAPLNFLPTDKRKKEKEAAGG